MTELILTSEPLFVNESEGEGVSLARSAYGKADAPDVNRLEKKLTGMLQQFFNLIGGKK